MANGDPWLAGSDVETGDDPGSEAQAALGGALAGGGQPSPAAAPTPTAGAGPGGGYNPLADLNQIMGALGQLPGPQQPPAGAQITQRHGGLLTGLAGVLLDGLAGGLAPTAEEAFQRPMQRQQQQMQMAEMQLRQQQAQQEMAMAPIKMKAQMAQSAINILQAGHMLRDLSKEHQIDMLGAQYKYTQTAIDEGRARLDATAPTLKDAQARMQELQAQNKDTALNYGYAPTKWDDQGNATEYGVYESYPKGALQKDFEYTFAGDKELGINEEHVKLPAGMQESEARLRLSAVANEHAAAMKLASDRLTQQRMIETEKRTTEITPKDIWKEKMEDQRQALNRAAQVANTRQTQGLKSIDDLYNNSQHGYAQFASQADSVLGAIDAAKNGNQLAASLEPMMLALGVSSFAGVHRINTVEIDRAGPQVGSLLRRVNAMLDRAGTGTIPADSLKEARGIVNSLIDARHSAVSQAARLTAANTGVDPKTVTVMDRDGSLVPLANVSRKIPGGEEDRVQIRQGNRVFSIPRNKLAEAQRRDKTIQVVQ